MLLASPRNKPPIYRLRPGVTLDSYGDPVESWATPDKVRLHGAYVQDVSTVEEEGPGKRILKGERKLFAPGAPDVLDTDRIQEGSQVWRVSGVPAVRTGRASAKFTTATLTRLTTS